MKLIIDSGSTKADWALLDNGGVKHLSSPGLNPCFTREQEIIAIINQTIKPDLDKLLISEIYFYGAGCSEMAQQNVINDSFKSVFLNASIKVYIDTMAAVVATCGDEPGIACIIGTGSNSVYFDGKNINPNNYGLGYILADEGAGTFLGKKLITHYLYGILPNELRQDFKNEYALTRDQVIENCYNRPQANTWLASFSKFLLKHKNHMWVKNTVSDGFDEFMHLYIMNYADYQKLPAHFIGSIAYLYRDLLEIVAMANKVRVGKIIQKPMDGLVEFYSK
jgi:glucosamine kinase